MQSRSSRRLQWNQKKSLFYALKLPVRVDTNIKHWHTHYLIAIWNVVLKLVNHPNIIHMEGLYENKHNIYIVMEKLKGGELFESIGKLFLFSFSKFWIMIFLYICIDLLLFSSLSLLHSIPFFFHFCWAQLIFLFSSFFFHLFLLPCFLSVFLLCSGSSSLLRCGGRQTNQTSSRCCRLPPCNITPFFLTFILIDEYGLYQDLGIVHRDLKPENILCGENLEDLKIADFGLSKMVLPKEKMDAACGTLSYVAPEEGYGKEADLWSVGVIMFLLMCGKLPFDGADQNEIIRNTIQVLCYAS